MTSEFTCENLTYTSSFERPGSAKGSLLANDGTGLFDLLAVGADGTVLTANSSTSTGLQWDTPDVTTLTSAGGTETLVVDGVGPTLSTKGLTAGPGVTLTGGANDVTVATNADASVFEYNGTVVRSNANNTSYNLNADFVFGSQQLNDVGNPSEDARMIFDKSIGAFRVGTADGTQWNTRGNFSFSGGGSNNIVTGARSATLGGFNLSVTAGPDNSIIGGSVNVISATGGRHVQCGGFSSNIVGTGSENGIFAGRDHDVDGGRNTVVGGNNHQINTGSTDCSIVGGILAQVTASSSFIGGGNTNILNSTTSASGIIGGTTCQITATNSFIGSGSGNILNSGTTTSGIVGGVSCQITGTDSFIGAGDTNIISGNTSESGIVAGLNNTLNNEGESAIIAGRGNDINNTTGPGSTRAVIVGGLNNDLCAENGNILGGQSNAISGGFDACSSVICGGDTNVINGTVSACPDCVIVGGDTNTIQNGASQSIIDGGISNNIQGTESSYICAGNTCQITVGFNNVIAGGNMNEIVTSADNNNIIGGGANNTISDGSNNGIIAGNGNTVQGGCSRSVIVGGNNNNINIVSSEANNIICAGFSNTITGGDSNFVSGNNNDITSGDGSFAAGRQISIGNEGCFVFSDGGTTTDWGSRTFTCRVRNGARFYTTASGTGTGVQVSSGGTSWASICDRNAKDIIATMDGIDTLNRLKNVGVYEFTYKEGNQDAINRGPVAQEFNTAFPAGSKDPLRIETLDLDGVGLSAIKGLHKLVEQLQEENKSFKLQLEEMKNNYESRLQKLEKQLS